MNTEKEVKVLSMDVMNDSSPLKALCTVQIDELQVRGVRIVQKEGRPLRIAMPASKRYNPDTTISYIPFIVVTNETLRMEIEKAILKEFERRR